MRVYQFTMVTHQNCNEKWTRCSPSLIFCGMCTKLLHSEEYPPAACTTNDLWDVASKLRDKSFLKGVRASPLIMFDQDFPQRCHQDAEVLPSPPRPRYFGSTELPIVPTAWEISWRNWSTWRHAVGMGEDIKNWQTGIYKNEYTWHIWYYMIIYGKRPKWSNF